MSRKREKNDGHHYRTQYLGLLPLMGDVIL